MGATMKAFMGMRGYFTARELDQLSKESQMAKQRTPVDDKNTVSSNGPLYDAVPHDNPELIPNPQPTVAEQMLEAAGPAEGENRPNPTAAHPSTVNGVAMPKQSENSTSVKPVLSTLSQTEPNKMQTTPQSEPKKRTRQTSAEKPARSRRNYQAEHAALQMKVDIGIKLLVNQQANSPTRDPIIAAAIELLS